jgi:N-acetylmuramoyl-L-alanine amidase
MRKNTVGKKSRIFGLVLFFMILFLLLLYIKYDEGRMIKQKKDLTAADEIFTVVIDPGHGGKDVGATGASGQYEKDFTLNLATKLRDILEQEEQLEVHMTREEDTFISTEDMYRPRFANELDADIFISIHGNTYEDPKVSGTEAYYYHQRFRSFAEIIYDKVAASTGFQDRGVKRNDFFVVKNTDMPSVLLEIGYLTNPVEEQRMLEDDFQQSTAEAIRDGVKEYLGLDAEEA